MAGGITNLQDARYGAAVGIDLLSFSLVQGSERKMPLSLVREIAGWVEGPGVVLELDQRNLDELAGIDFDCRYLYLSEEAMEPAVWELGYALILSMEASSSEQALKWIAAGQDKGVELKVELPLMALTATWDHADLLPHAFLQFHTLEWARQYWERPQPMAFGLSLREEAEERFGYLDYEQLDQLIGVD